MVNLENFEKNDNGKYIVPGVIEAAEISQFGNLELFVKTELGYHDKIKLNNTEKVDGEWQVTDNSMARADEYAQENFGLSFSDLADGIHLVEGKTVNLFTVDGENLYLTDNGGGDYKKYAKPAKEMKESKTAPLTGIIIEEHDVLVEFEVKGEEYVKRFKLSGTHPKDFKVRYYDKFSSLVGKYNLMYFFGSTTPEFREGVEVEYIFKTMMSSGNLYSDIVKVLGYEEDRAEFRDFDENFESTQKGNKLKYEVMEAWMKHKGIEVK